MKNDAGACRVAGRENGRTKGLNGNNGFAQISSKKFKLNNIDHNCGRDQSGMHGNLSRQAGFKFSNRSTTIVALVGDSEAKRENYLGK
jgi:hypothetical protein